MPQPTADQSSATVEDPIDDLHESAFFRRGCCCFWNFSCFKKSDSWERIGATSEDRQHEKDEDGHCTLWGKGLEALKKAREWSELVAGPKWKTFIRRFNKTGRSRTGKFQYDPLSYALNFDEGQNGDFEVRDFSSRYAAIHSGLLKDIHALT